MTTTFETLDLQREGALLVVSLNRPEARNALNLRMCDDLFAFEQEIAADDSVRTVVIRAEGPAFCAGADLKERKDKDEAWVRERRRRAFAAYEAIRCAEVPHIAVVNGAVVGSGGELAMACDFIYASTAATFRFPEALWGTVGATQRLPRAVGTAYAKELIFTGRVIQAAEAHHIGLVQRLFNPATIDAETQEIATTIANGPPLAMRLAKRSIDVGASIDLTNGIAVERLAIDRCLADKEWRAGVESFNSKRGNKSR